MIYIQVNDNKDVTTIDYLPFDEIHGLGKTKEELLETGFLVNEIPSPDTSDKAKDAILKYDNGSLYYEYYDRPLTTEEEVKRLKQENAQLKTDMNNAIMELTMLIAMGGNA